MYYKKSFMFVSTVCIISVQTLDKIFKTFIYLFAKIEHLTTYGGAVAPSPLLKDAPDLALGINNSWSQLYSLNFPDILKEQFENFTSSF